MSNSKQIQLQDNSRPVADKLNETNLLLLNKDTLSKVI